jgi:hypothetical protein
MARNPFAPPVDYTDRYNTTLSQGEEAEFQRWRAALPPNLQNLRDYDLRGAWKSRAQASANNHLPDTYKKPNHMTFSEGSIYANRESRPGQWVENAGRWTYRASPDLGRYRDPSAVLNYFQYAEPDSQVRLPNLFTRRGR